jgi:hypothetical protein
MSRAGSIGPADDTGPILTRCRIVAGLLAVVPVVLAGASTAVDLRAPVGPLALPAALGGAIAPVVAYRLFTMLRSRVPADADIALRGERYLSGLVVALGVTEATALGGVLIAEFTGEPLALLGLATHVLTAGALWPSDERVRGYHGETRSA